MWQTAQLDVRSLLPITVAVAGFYGIMHVALTMIAGATRGQTNIMFGDGGNSKLFSRIRAHGNFAEQVPIFLILLTLSEATHSLSTTALRAVALFHVFGRIAHALLFVSERSIAVHKVVRPIAMIPTVGTVVVLGGSLLLSSL